MGVTKEAGNDGGRRSVLRRLGSDHQPRVQNRLGLDRLRGRAASQQQGPAGAIGTSRFLIGLLLLKYICGVSDEGISEGWIYHP
jgi:hypothetical protein